jgi:hypothetical protein
LPFVKKCFCLLDRDHSGKLDFGEFVVCSWSLCSYNRKSLARFAFELYDRDSSGTLSMTEVMAIIKDVYNFKWQDNIGDVTESADVRMTKAMESVKKRMDETGSMALGGFESLVHANQLVLFPCFKLHQQLRNNIVGEQFWSRLEGQRRSLRSVRVGGREIQIRDPFDSRQIIRALFWGDQPPPPPAAPGLHGGEACDGHGHGHGTRSGGGEGEPGSHGHGHGRHAGHGSHGSHGSHAGHGSHGSHGAGGHGNHGHG